MTSITYAGSPVNTDFMVQGYAAIIEPLNLTPARWQWFGECWGPAPAPPRNRALMLGAVPWMMCLLRRTGWHPVVADQSAPMLSLCRDALNTDDQRAVAGTPELIQANWLELSAVSQPFALATGDNSLSFLRFPDDWENLCSALADRLSRGGRLVIRVLSAPAHHRLESVDELVARFAAQSSINSSEVRAALLFAHWNPRSYEIDTERALDTFEARASAFAPLLDRLRAAGHDDLSTVRKYRGAGAFYAAPPLERLLPVIRQRFEIEGVHVGRYPMSEYFPLITATRRS